MRHKEFRLSPDLWMANKALRACSPAARGFCVDLMCLCFDGGGHLLINGLPVDDTQLARIIGEPIGKIRAWLKDLGDSGIYQVDDDGLYFEAILRQVQVREKAKKEVSPKKSHYQKTKELLDAAGVGSIQVQEVIAESPNPAPIPVPPQVQRVKAADWWKSNAGWIRKGGEHAMSMNPDEDIVQFKIRVAARLPVGAHLDVLTPAQVRQVEAMKPKDPSGRLA